MKILDRYIIRSFLVSYLIIAFVLIGLYVLVDFTLNADEFTKDQERTAGQVFGDILSYYGHQVFVYFMMLGGIVTLVSAVVTLTTMNRRNEMTAILASGVSLYRVIWPVVLLGLLFNGLGIANQELIIPGMADQLVRDRDEAAGLKKFAMWFVPIYGAGSVDDRCRVRRVATGAGGQGEAVLWMQPADGSGEGGGGGDGTVTAIAQTRPGDVLAICDGDGPAVRAFVRVTRDPWPDSPAAAVDEVSVTARDVAQTGYDGFESATDGDLRNVRAGDLVRPVNPPIYYFSALWFYPDADSYRMENVVIVKRHPTTFEPLSRVAAAGAAWDAAAGQWRLSPDAAIAFTAPPAPGQEYLPTRRAAGSVAPIDTVSSPRHIVLRNSGSRWMQFMSTADLKTLADSPGAVLADRARSVMHVRFTQPGISMILLLLGVPFVLTRAPVGLWQGILRCVLLSGGCFILSFVCQQISGDARSGAVVAAWLPVILFGPLAVLLLDSVKT